MTDQGERKADIISRIAAPHKLLKEIAAEAGVSGAYAGFICRVRNLPYSNTRTILLSPGNIERFKRLKAEGLRPRTIAVEMGLSADQVYYIANQLNARGVRLEAHPLSVPPLLPLVPVQPPTKKEPKRGRGRPPNAGKNFPIPNYKTERTQQP